MDRFAVAGGPLNVTELGETPQLRPLPVGNVQLSFTVPLNPPTDESLRVELVDCPADTVAEVGEALIVKFGRVTKNTVPLP